MQLFEATGGPAKWAVVETHFHNWTIDGIISRSLALLELH
jgi:hypothetical protein